MNAVNNAPPGSTPLAQLSVGDHARIVEVKGGRQLARRLLSLGLRVGMELDVVHRKGRGVVVATAGTRVALGGGVADKLMMARCPASPQQVEGAASC